MKRGNKLVVFLFILLSIIMFFPKVSALEIGGQTLIGTIVSILYPPTGCDMIIQPSGIPMFIPNRTLAEYNSFKGAVSRLGITLVSGCCGNGVVNTGEGCDNGAGNTNTACSAVYGSSCSYCDKSCVAHTITGPYCGDGTKQSNEGCDDGVGNTNTACSPLPESSCTYCNTSCKALTLYGPKSGGWSAPIYGPCSVDCGTGTWTVTKYCNNPLPQYGGSCAVDNYQYWVCDTWFWIVCTHSHLETAPWRTAYTGEGVFYEYLLQSDSTAYENSCYAGECNDPPVDPIPAPPCTDDCTCFTENTLVKTLNGEEEISKLNLGDKVLSYNTENNQFVYSQIEKLLIHKYSIDWYYLVKTQNSQVEVTNVHPFYVGGKYYRKIEELNKGDIIYVNVNGKLVQEPILSKERIDLPKLITVYNLELNEDGPKNYFANGYLVHNGDHFFDWITGHLVEKGA